MREEYSSVPLKDLSPEERQKMIERSAERRKGSDHRPMDMDRDFSWEHTDFKDCDND